MGKFKPGSTFKNSQKKWNPTVGRSYKMDCPPHILGYGTEYRWGVVNAVTRIPEYWRPGDPNPRVFQDIQGALIYSVVLNDDLKESRNVGGLRCILTNFGITRSSNQQVLWQPYDGKEIISLALVNVACGHVVIDFRNYVYISDILQALK